MKDKIKGLLTKKKLFRFFKIALIVIFTSVVFLSLFGTVAHATGLVDDTVNADNLYSQYPLENYQLDFYVDNSWGWLPWNWLDGIGKSVQYGLYCITNFIWTISLYLSNATGYVVQQAYKLDFINDMADSIGKSIQTLAGVTENGFGSTGFYVGFLLLIILIVGIYVAYTGLIKRETSKALHAVINFVVVFVLSASFIASSGVSPEKGIITAVVAGFAVLLDDAVDDDDEGTRRAADLYPASAQQRAQRKRQSLMP